MYNNNQKISVWVIIMLVWFLLSLVLLVAFAGQNDTEKMFLVLGQYVVGFGVMTLSSNNESKKNHNQSMANKNDAKIIIQQNKVLLVKQEDGSYVATPVVVDRERFIKSTTRLGYFLLIGGIAIIICVYLAFNPEVLGVEIDWVKLFFTVLFSSAVIVSCKMCYNAIKRINNLKKRCFVEVVATISKYVEGRKGIQYPVYKFMFNGKEYFICHNRGSRPILTPVGSEIKLMINPSMPYEYMSSDFNFEWLELLFDVSALAISLFALIAVIIKM